MSKNVGGRPVIAKMVLKWKSRSCRMVSVCESHCRHFARGHKTLVISFTFSSMSARMLRLGIVVAVEEPHDLAPLPGVRSSTRSSFSVLPL